MAEQTGLLAGQGGGDGGDARGGDEHTFTIDEALEHIGYGPFQFRLFVLVGMAFASDAMEMLLLSFLAPMLECVWHINHAQGASIVSVFFVGMIIGAPLWGHYADKQGRRSTFLLLTIFISVFGLLSSVSSNLTGILILQGLVGVGIGGIHVLYTLTSEFLPPGNRAQTLLWLTVFWAAGSILEAGVAWVVLPRLGWRWTIIISMVPMAVMVFLSPLVPESPRFLLSKGRAREAQEVLQRVAHENGKELPRGRLVQRRFTVIVSPAAEEEEDEQERRDMETKSTLSMLFDPYSHLLYTSVILVFLWFVSTSVYYGNVLATTTIYSEDLLARRCHRADIKPNIRNVPDPSRCKHDLFKERDYIDVFITATAELPAVALVAVSLHLFSRRSTMALFYGSAALCHMFLLFFCTNRTMDALALAGCRALTLAGWQAVWVYTQEVLPDLLRSSGTGVFSSISRVGGVLTAYVASVLTKKNVNYPFIIYGSAVALASMFAWMLPVETRGRAMPHSRKDVRDVDYPCSGRNTPIPQEEMDMEDKRLLAEQHDDNTY